MWCVGHFVGQESGMDVDVWMLGSVRVLYNENANINNYDCSTNLTNAVNLSCKQRSLHSCDRKLYSFYGRQHISFSSIWKELNSTHTALKGI